MKKYLVIGNPIEHSKSPDIHNYWMKINKINGQYNKLKLNDDKIKDLILNLRNQDINGVNVTVPFKKKIIPFLDDLSPEARQTQSVNTISIKNKKLIGYNTDIIGFELSIAEKKFEIKGKTIFIIGSGGVVPSIIFALKKMEVSKIIVCNRTKHKAENLKNLFNEIEIVDWGTVPYFDVVINATSVGLNKNENIELNFLKIRKENLFYDVIYNPKETKFLELGKKRGSYTQNGAMMFAYQAQIAFEIWHGVKPLIDNKVLEILNI